MSALETLNIPALDAVLTAAAGAINSIQLPAATAGSVAAGMALVPCLLAAAWLALRLTRQPPADAGLTARVDELGVRLQATELLLADATSQAAQLRQRVDQLTSRQESAATEQTRAGLRQAIALSKHGASTRQLIDACSLSQGEAHLIQTLYGRPAGGAEPEELH